MANGFVTAGGGVGSVILQAIGTEGTKVTATLGTKKKEGYVGKDGVLQLKLPGIGLWHVASELDQNLFEQDVKLYHYGITECVAITKKAFSECTPAEIQSIARSGLSSDLWEIGDKHRIVMKDKQEIYLQIYGFNQDLDSSGVNTLPLTLGMQNCFSETQSMNTSGTNAGGWSECNFRKSTLNLLREKFPDEWKNIMTKCQKKTSSGSNNSTINITNDDLFMFSEIELLGTVTYSYPGEGEVYKIFTDGGSRVKTVNGGASAYWTRSPAKGKSTNFCNIGYGGSPNYGNDGSAGIIASTLSGVVLGFCVG